MPAYQAVVEHHVHDVREHVGDHRDARLPYRAHARAQAEREVVEYEPAGDHLEVAHRELARVVVRAGEVHERAGESIAQHAHDYGEHRHYHHRLLHDRVRRRAVAFALPARDERRGAHAERLREYQEYHARLRGHAHRRDGFLAERADHHRVDGADHAHQHALHRRRPGDAEHVPVHLAELGRFFFEFEFSETEYAFDK